MKEYDDKTRAELIKMLEDTTAAFELYKTGSKNDIVELWRTEEALRESEEKYRIIFEKSPLGLLSFNQQGEILACNQVFAQIIGTTQLALIGLNMLTLRDIKLVEAVKISLNGGIGYYEDNYVSVLANKKTYVRVIFSPIDNSIGQIIGGVGIIEDVSERKKSEDSLQEKMEELLSFQNLTVGRELKMIELKKEINSLLKKLGEPEKYIIV